MLRDVTLGVGAGDRIGVVGRNGDGKSTLLRLIAGAEEPDAGARHARRRRRRSRCSARATTSTPARTIREELVGGRADHEWAGDARFRAVLDGLLGGVEVAPLPARAWTRRSRRSRAASGGAIALARLLLGEPELLLLDEPTNHLDVEGVDWLARHLAARRGSLVVVTHDRWFLDAVCTATWEVADGGVHQYEGGYAAYVLARAERDRAGGGARGAPPAAAAQGARVAAARPAGAHLEAEVPHRGRQRADRRRAGAARPRRAAALRRPRGSATRCSTPIDVSRRLRRPPRAARRDLAARARATASRSSASTARARRR